MARREPILKTTDPAELAAVEARFSAEAAAFGLRFRCAACCHVTRALSCSLGYPNAALTGPVAARDGRGEPTSCKYFELGETELDDPGAQASAG
ncbi:MAG: hypothetical protein KC635_08750 [Myxococcales bacterium]|nr:hypothetical protein [Myxococcales bacterium]MCB9731139.1 hypothetical protein [Deltaproteobacteria bacterium]